MPKPWTPRTLCHSFSSSRRRCRSKRICMRVEPLIAGIEPTNDATRCAGSALVVQVSSAALSEGAAGVCAAATPGPARSHATTTDPIHVVQSMRWI